MISGLGLAISLLLVTAPASPVVPAERGEWQSLPGEARTVLLLTGADDGFVVPNPCGGGIGGSLYRPEFDRWLDERRPGLERIWLGTGDVLDSFDDENAVAPEAMYRHLAGTGYLAVGVGSRDLAAVGAAKLVDLAASEQLAVVATNLRIHETGEPALTEVITLDTAVGRLAVLAVLRHRPGQIWGSPRHGTIVTVDPIAALRPVLEQVRDDADIVVLLSTLSKVELSALIRAVDGIDLVAATDGAVARLTAEPVGDRPTLWLGNDGRVLGRAALGDDARLLQADGIEVRGRFPVDPATGELQSGDAPPAIDGR